MAARTQLALTTRRNSCEKASARTAPHNAAAESAFGRGEKAANAQPQLDARVDALARGISCALVRSRSSVVGFAFSATALGAAGHTINLKKAALSARPCLS